MLERRKVFLGKQGLLGEEKQNKSCMDGDWTEVAGEGGTGDHSMRGLEAVPPPEGSGLCRRDWRGIPGPSG